MAMGRYYSIVEYVLHGFGNSDWVQMFQPSLAA